eukprot:Seg387.10 transcript_id=Seg387.10/GoldUCD/mRNA.D3Y31 product="hypothetical protein" protein_id=Seg387.10/GoldUCD/D3Y31
MYSGQKTVSKNKIRSLYDIYKRAIHRKDCDMQKFPNDSYKPDETIVKEETPKAVERSNSNDASSFSSISLRLDSDISDAGLSDAEFENNKSDSNVSTYSDKRCKKSVEKASPRKELNEDGGSGTAHYSGLCGDNVKTGAWHNDTAGSQMQGENIDISIRNTVYKEQISPAPGRDFAARSDAKSDQRETLNLTDYAASICSRIACDIAKEILPLERQQFGMQNRDKVVLEDRKTSTESTKQEDGGLQCMKDAVADPQPQGTFYSDDDTKDDEGTFSTLGIKPSTLSMVADSNLPRDGIFTAVPPPNTSIKLPDSWHKHIGPKRLIGDWTTFLHKLIKEQNPHCTLVFKGNNVSSLQSRKKNCPYISGFAVCAHRPLCKAEVHFDASKRDTGTMNFNFKGVIKHDLRERRARRMAGETRDNRKTTFEKNLNMPPSDVYRKDLADIKAGTFAAGDRTGAGVSRTVTQQMKNEVQKEYREPQLLYAKLLSIQNELKKEDEGKAMELRHFERKLFGFLHCIELAPSLRLVMLHEPLIRLYHGMAPRDILYLDATGTVVKQLKSFKRILFYSLCVRHPYGKSPPLPVTKFLSSSHRKEAISRSLSLLREKEKMIFNGNSSQPALIMVDNSYAIILACLHEFNNETLQQYIDRAYRIVTGKAQSSDMKQTLLHICYAHTMKWNKVMLEKMIKKRPGRPCHEVKDFLMRFFARLVECKTLDELTNLVEHGIIVLRSKFVTATVTNAVKYITDSINEYPHVADDVNKLMKEEAKHWSGVIKSLNARIKDDSTPDIIMINKFYNPDYAEYLISKKLPTSVLWTNVCLGDLTRFNPDYKSLFKPVSSAKDIHTQSKTSGQIEGYFSVLKRDAATLNLPVDQFVERLWTSRKGLRRQFVDGLWEGIAAKGKGTLTEKSAKNAANMLGNFENLNENARDEGETQAKKLVQESWQKSTPKKRGYNGRGEYRPGQRHVSFDPSPKTTKMAVSEMQQQIACKQFRDSEWFFSAEQSPTPDECMSKIKKKWRRLSLQEKGTYADSMEIAKVQQEKCSCGFSYDEIPNAMVQCDLCQVWYHVQCERVSFACADAATFYHCKECAFGNFLPFLRFVSHHKESISLGTRKTIDELHLEWTKRSVAEQANINDLYIGMNDSKPVRKHSGRSVMGIENPDSATCFMNATLQVICGSMIYNFLPKEREEITFVRLLNDLHQELTLPPPAFNVARCPVAMPFNASMYQLGVELKLDLWRKRQMDTLEFLDAILCNIEANEVQAGREEFTDTFFPTTVTLLICRSCSKYVGEIARPATFRLSVPECSSELPLTDLLWDAAACKYSLEREGIGCDCGVASSNAHKEEIPK